MAPLDPYTNSSENYIQMSDQTELGDVIVRLLETSCCTGDKRSVDPCYEYKHASPY